ncbi:hypothetical protein [uncultured Corynebacterium sp.]|jgi:hypothetical protein|uniref:hypothetical protein n=1 Tax=uncultured Corynebacterium sp. TaxID=159447 RepID=UPI002595F521|nr:hypothetical protein [uncultured Corynebacterium sp.]
MTSPVREILSYTLRREGEEDVYFEYSPEPSLGEQRIIACTEPQIGKFLKWAYIAWGEKGNVHGPGPTLYINVKDETGDDSLIQRKGLGTALYVLACIKAGKRLKSHPDQPRAIDGEELAKAMDQIDIEGILRGDISPGIVGLHAD